MTATLRWLPGPGPGCVPAIAIEAPRSRAHWSQARRLLLEYVEGAAAALRVDIREIKPRYWLEAETPATHYRGHDNLLLLAHHADEAVGVAGLQVHGDTAEVVRMYVRPTYRRRGIAVALLDGLRDEALRRGVRRLSLNTDPVGMAPAFRLYQRYGFRAVGPHRIDGVELLTMELVLTDPR